MEEDGPESPPGEVEAEAASPDADAQRDLLLDADDSNDRADEGDSIDNNVKGTGNPDPGDVVGQGFLPLVEAEEAHRDLGLRLCEGVNDEHFFFNVNNVWLNLMSFSMSIILPTLPRKRRAKKSAFSCTTLLVTMR